MRPVLFLTAAVALFAAATAQAQMRPDAAQMFALADTNHDGVVSRAEFRASRAVRFQALDRNHDGVLSAADFPAFAARRGAVALLEMFDANDDGRVTPDEFIQGSMRLFDQADANHDGMVSRAEALAAREIIRESLMARR